MGRSRSWLWALRTRWRRACWRRRSGSGSVLCARWAQARGLGWGALGTDRQVHAAGRLDKAIGIGRCRRQLPWDSSCLGTKRAAAAPACGGARGLAACCGLRAAKCGEAGERSSGGGRRVQGRGAWRRRAGCVRLRQRRRCSVSSLAPSPARRVPRADSAAPAAARARQASVSSCQRPRAWDRPFCRADHDQPSPPRRETPFARRRPAAASDAPAALLPLAASPAPGAGRQPPCALPAAPAAARLLLPRSAAPPTSTIAARPGAPSRAHPRPRWASRTLPARPP